MTGFSIVEVRAKGKDMPDAFVRFGRGLSLLTGPSDTGKSFVGDAINHVFGASGPLRALTPEQANYDRLLVEILVYETGETFTLSRAWAGGDIALSPLPAAHTEDQVDGVLTLKATSDGTTESVSGFLLSLSELDNKLLRTNEAGRKELLSFRELPIYTLVQEERIITKGPPILTGQYSTATKELSLFKLLLTGVDDSAVISAPDKKTRKGLDDGRQEVLNALVAEVRARIDLIDRTEPELREELAQVEEALANQTVYIRGASAEIEEKETRRKVLWSDRKKTEARTEQVRELVKRFSLLESLYTTDIARLESTQETGQLLVQLEEGLCPLCGAEPANHRHEGLLKSEDVASLTEACRAEQQKLVLLKGELQETLQKLREEDEQLSGVTNSIDAELATIQSTLFSELEPRVRVTKEGLEKLFERRQQAERGLSYFDELRRLESARGVFDIKAKEEKKKPSFDKTPAGVTDELAVLVGDILTSWDYPGIDRVVFDTLANDIVINGKPRGSHGKGYRAITYSAFVIGVMLFCRRKGLPHPGFVLLDSPLVTYRRPDKMDSEDDSISEGMVPPFYEYLSMLGEDCQVIIIENEEPSDDVKAKASAYNHFTRNKQVGRYGFLGEPLA